MISLCFFNLWFLNNWLLLAKGFRFWIRNFWGLALLNQCLFLLLGDLLYLLTFHRFADLWRLLTLAWTIWFHIRFNGILTCSNFSLRIPHWVRHTWRVVLLKGTRFSCFLGLFSFFLFFWSWQWQWLVCTLNVFRSALVAS